MSRSRDGFRFVAEVDENLKCAICLDVLDDPQSLSGCGHAYCKSCLEKSQLTSCPTCRQPFDSTFPANCVMGVIDSLQVQCCQGRQTIVDSQNQSGVADPTVQAGVDNKLSLGTLDTANLHDADECSWTGKLSDWTHHTKNECKMRIITCEVPGCSFSGSPEAMSTHSASMVHEHLNLYMADMKAKLENELRAEFKQLLSQELKAQKICFNKKISEERQHVVHLYLTSFCQRVLVNRPSSFQGFRLYYETAPDQVRGFVWLRSPFYVTRLLCAVPFGEPKPVCLIPVLLEWTTVHQPPTCRFPKQYSVNQRECPRFPGSTFSRSLEWEPEVTISKLLASIHQWIVSPEVLARVDLFDPSLQEQFPTQQFVDKARVSLNIQKSNFKRVYPTIKAEF